MLPADPTANTTVVREDIDGSPPGGAAGRFDSSHHRSWRCQRWRVPSGVLLIGLVVATTVVREGVDGGGP
jgi:hypothetical protein